MQRGQLSYVRQQRRHHGPLAAIGGHGPVAVPSALADERRTADLPRGADVHASAPPWLAPRRLIVGRSLQSLGEGLVLPDGLSVHEQRLPTDKRVRAVSIWSGATAVASGVAPAVARVACG
jgi:MFS family permease